MSFAFNDDEAARFLDPEEDEKTRDGMKEIAKSLAAFRDELTANGFSENHAFLLVRDHFGLLLDAGLKDSLENEE